MRLFLDECLSPGIERALNAEGAHLAVSTEELPPFDTPLRGYSG